VKYFVNHLDQVVKLSAEQKTTLLDTATDNEVKKLYFTRELKILAENDQGNSTKTKNIRHQIKKKLKKRKVIY